MDQRVHGYMCKNKPRGRDLMNLLPQYTTLAWRDHTIDGSRQTAITLGIYTDSEGTKEICATLKQQSQRDLVQFWISKKGGWGLEDYENIIAKHNSAITTTFVPPFQHLGDVGDAARMKFGAVVKWYFIAKGLVAHRDQKLDKFYSLLHQALQQIGMGMAEQTVARETAGDYMQDSIAQGTDANEEDGAAQEQEDEESSEVAASQQLVPQHEEQTPMNDEKETEEQRYFRDQMVDSDLEWILVHHEVPFPDEMRFSSNKYKKKYASKRLYIGKRREDGGCAYAYLSTNAKELKFNLEFVEAVAIRSGGSHPTIVHSRELGGLSYELARPFHLIYREKKETLDNAEQFYLRVIVIWYFIMKGITQETEWSKEYSPKRTKNYTRDLLETLRWISEQLRRSTRANDPNDTPFSPSAEISPTFSNIDVHPISSQPSIANGLQEESHSNGSTPEDTQSTLESSNGTRVTGFYDPITDTVPLQQNPHSGSRPMSYTTSPTIGRSDTDGIDIATDPRAESAQSVFNSSLSSAIQPLADGTKETASSQTRGAETHHVAVVQTPLFTSPSGSRGGRRISTVPRATSSASDQIPLTGTAPDPICERLPTPDSLSSGARRPPSSSPTPAPHNSTAPVETVDLESDLVAPRGSKRSLAEEIDEQLEGALLIRDQVKRDHVEVQKELHDLAEQKEDFERHLDNRKYQISLDHNVRQEKEEKQLEATKKEQGERIEAEIQRKIEQMKAEMKQKMVEMDSEIDERIKEIKDERRRALESLEHEDKEWQDGWETQHNELQSREHEVKRRKLTTSKRVAELIKRLQQAEEDEETDV